MHREQLIIAIDGPAGAGKSVVGTMLAERLGYIHLSTGAIYRSVGWKADKEGIQFDDIPAMMRLIDNTRIEFQKKDRTQTLLVDGNDVTNMLSTNEVGKLASAVSVIPEVRAGLLSLQRQAGRHGGVVLDGRDIGTVVFPDADIKFYLDASPEERAKRRFLQLKRQGRTPNLDQLILDIKKRDYDDSTREIAPLRQAEDAIYIDSTSLSLQEVVDTMLAEIRKIIDIH